LTTLATRNRARDQLLEEELADRAGTAREHLLAQIIQQIVDVRPLGVGILDPSRYRVQAVSNRSIHPCRRAL
jgi:hypothetical protein